MSAMNTNPPPTPVAAPELTQPQPENQPSKAVRRGGGAAVGPRKNGAENFGNKWATSMMKAPCNNGGMCLLGCFCPWCCTFKQRKQLLEGNMDRYVCCGGICGPCTRCVDGPAKKCPTFCLCLEVVICLGCAVHGNRWLVQQRYQLENECCDIFIMWLACICSCLACILGDDSLELLSDIIFYITIGCMLSQHDYEMKTRGFPNEAPNAQVME